mgnify:CR=1 FL=1
MNFINKILIRLSSKKIGSDEFDNNYFQNKDGKRFVVYNGMAEPSKIPFEWHGWMHYTTNTPPIQMNTHKLSWQKIHLPNLTGTKNAYSPGNSKRNSKKDSTINSNIPYESWKPNN